MESPGGNTVLRRKATAAKEVWQARAMSPAKALRLSIARAADDLWDLPAAASGIAQTEEGQDDMLASLPEGGLLMLLDGPEGLIGAAHLPFAIVSAVIEVQTIGMVSKLDPDTRPVTRTDAAMVAPLIDAMCEKFDALLEEEGIAPWARGYRFGTMMESARMLSLALKATDFHVMRFNLDLAALREGEAVIMFPVPDPGMSAEGAGGGALVDPGAFEAQVLQASTELRAVLHRVTMPLSEVSALQVGAVLEIPAEAIGRTQIETRSNTVIGTTKLGQVNGMRAVRMHLPDLPGTGTPDQNPAAGALTAQAAPEVEVSVPPAMPMMPDVAEIPVDLPEPEPDPVPQQDDLLGDLPDLGDLPGMGEIEDLPDLGTLPMADLPPLE